MRDVTYRTMNERQSTVNQGRIYRAEFLIKKFIIAKKHMNNSFIKIYIPESIALYVYMLITTVNCMKI
jgi:hypothetical protein